MVKTEDFSTDSRGLAQGEAKILLEKPEASAVRRNNPRLR